MSDFREDYNKILTELSQSYNGETGIEKINLVSLTASALHDVDLRGSDSIFATILARLYDNNIADLKRDTAKILFLDDIAVQAYKEFHNKEERQIYSERKRKEFLRIIWHCLMLWMRYDASFILNEIDKRYCMKEEM